MKALYSCDFLFLKVKAVSESKKLRERRDWLLPLLALVRALHPEGEIRSATIFAHLHFHR